MARWETLELEAPELAARGRELLYQYGPGLAFLATIRPDGGLRIHPFCPVVAEGGIYGLIIDSPKRRDLARDGRFALHAFAPADRDDEFMLSGTAHRVSDTAVIERVAEAFHAAGATSNGDEWVFEFDIERALLSLYNPRGVEPQWPPRYIKWQAPS